MSNNFLEQPLMEMSKIADKLQEENEKLKLDNARNDKTLIDREKANNYYNAIIELKTQLKKQKEINKKAIDFIKNGDLLYLANKNSIVYKDNIEIKAVVDRLYDLLQILEDKEV